MQSIWNMPVKNYPFINKDIKTQVVVVGGGIAGFLTAFKLSNLNYEVTLIEANKIFSGTTINTTAFITALQGPIYNKIANKHGVSAAKLYFDSQQRAIAEYEQLVNKYDINCNFKRLPTYLFTKKQNTKKMEKEYNTLKKITDQVKLKGGFSSVNINPTKIIQLPNQATFHPLKFLKGLPINFNIYEQSRVIKVNFKNKTLKVNNHTVKAENIIIATGFPIFDHPKMLFTKMYQSASYCQAYLNSNKVNGLYVEDKQDGKTLRDYEDYLIVGGLDHRTGRIKNQAPFNTLTQSTNKIFNNIQLTNSWLSQDCMTFDNIPYVGQIDKKYKNCYVITGFNKWGMANAMAASSLIADLVENKKNVFKNLFSLNRNAVLKNKISFLVNAFESVKNLSKTHFHVPIKDYKELKPGEGGIFIIKGKKYGVYKNRQGKIYKVKPNCSHKNCQLTFNKITATFDCPCHGSSYNIKGEIIHSPAVKKINTNN